MDSSLSELIIAGATIITPTQRLSRHLRHQFATSQIAQGKQAWQTPDCLPWTAWCKRSFETLSLRSKEQGVLLNGLQQQWLWQEIISTSKYKHQLLQMSATATQAIQAYRLCKAWSVPIFPNAVYLSEDAFAFKSWVESYEGQKRENGWLDDASLPDYIVSHIAEAATLAEKVIFYDFDQLTTQQLKLKQALIDCGIDVVELGATQANQSVTLNEENDKQAEIRAAACWAKEHLESDADATIGIVAPNLRALRNKLEYGFASVFTPKKWVKPNEALHKPYAISLGEPLARYPLIHTAINLLALGKRQVSIKSLSTLLNSPFIQGAIEESASRAKFDVALRRLGTQQLGLKPYTGWLKCVVRNMSNVRASFNY